MGSFWTRNRTHVPCLHWQEDSLPLSYQWSPQVAVILSVSSTSSWDCTGAAGSWPWHQKVDRAKHEPEWGEPNENGATSCYVLGNVPSGEVRASQWGERRAGRWERPGPWLLGVLPRKPTPVGKEPKPKSDWCSQTEAQLEGLDRLPPAGQTQEPAWKGFLKNPLPAVRKGWEGLPWGSSG